MLVSDFVSAFTAAHIISDREDRLDAKTSYDGIFRHFVHLYRRSRQPPTSRQLNSPLSQRQTIVRGADADILSFYSQHSRDRFGNMETYIDGVYDVIKDALFRYGKVLSDARVGAGNIPGQLESLVRDLDIPMWDDNVIPRRPDARRMMSMTEIGNEDRKFFNGLKVDDRYPGGAAHDDEMKGRIAEYLDYIGKEKVFSILFGGRHGGSKAVGNAILGVFKSAGDRGL